MRTRNRPRRKSGTQQALAQAKRKRSKTLRRLMGPETLERREVMAAELGAPYLVSDTGSPGDQITSDPRIGGAVGGAWNGASAIIEFDHNADGIAEGSRLVTSSGQSYVY